MLINFSVENFLSFGKRQEFSMVASSKHEETREIQHSFTTGFEQIPYALQTACLLGPNASGKSNFVKALFFMRKFVINSAREGQAGDLIDVTPFKLIKKNANFPSEFEIAFIHNGAFYEYGFALYKNKVWREWLFKKNIVKRSRFHPIFQREFDQKTKKYKWDINPALKGSKETWKESTRDNALFLSTAIQLKSESLLDVFEWFRKFFRPISSAEKLSNNFTLDFLKEDSEKLKIVNFIKSVDIGIHDFEVEQISKADTIKRIIDSLELDLTKDKEGELKKELELEIRKDLEENKITPVNVRTKHITPFGDVFFDLTEESDGTNVLFNIAGPIIDVLENGYTVIFDELSNSLHPFAVRFLISLFNNKEINKNKAQLIFTSHDVSILNPEIMQRDQIWFIQKNSDGSSDLFPLSDFKPRDNEIYDKGYLAGRYGALPKIKGFI